MNQSILDDIRPYTDVEVPAAVKRISESIFFPQIVHYLYPEHDVNEEIKRFCEIKTVHDFQLGYMRNAVEVLIGRTIKELTHDGVDGIQKDKPYLFLSNHRDIMLDSTLLLYVLSFYDFKIAEITFGSNLMTSQFVVDFGKINKMFKFQRISGSSRDILEFSKQNSEYIRYAISQKKESVWIAQRNGRTKDGFDRTDAGVLKMFSMSNKADFAQNLGELNIVPISISYEFEPCDFMKTREVYISRRRKYVKEENEDMQSIIHGILQWKGNVHVSICSPVSSYELDEYAELSKNDRFKQLANGIDSKIYANYKLWPNNYIAYDILNKTNRYSKFYSEKQRNSFIEYATQGLKNIEGDKDELESIFLGIYANPVTNYYCI